jgi:transposase
MKLHDLARMVLTTRLRDREIGSALQCSHNTVGRYRERLSEEALNWSLVQGMSEDELESRLNKRRSEHRKRFIEPDYSSLHNELRRPGVTMSLLYEEYAVEAYESAMSESEFRRRYAKYEKSLGIVMRQPRLPGEQLFLDYSGKRPHVINSETGEVRPVELFVAVMGASRMTFAYATETQRLKDWCEANVKALEFFGGVPNILVPDNLKSAVDRVSKQEGAVINHTFLELARHYDTVVIPARPRKPKDKAPVEIGVLLIQRWVLARIRNRSFFSLDELNEAIAKLLISVNSKPMRNHQGKSRLDLFRELDQPVLKPLPQIRYEWAEWRLSITIPQDYHIAWNNHYYSVPYRFIGSKVRLRITRCMIEVFHKNSPLPIASHIINNKPGEATTNPDHLPMKHRKYMDGNLESLLEWAASTGSHVRAFADNHRNKHQREIVTISALQGLKTLAREYGAERLNLACCRAMRINSTAMSSVRSILNKKLESSPIDGDAEPEIFGQHENVRGKEQFNI